MNNSSFTDLSFRIQEECFKDFGQRVQVGRKLMRSILSNVLGPGCLDSGLEPELRTSQTSSLTGPELCKHAASLPTLHTSLGIKGVPTYLVIKIINISCNIFKKQKSSPANSMIKKNITALIKTGSAGEC